MMYRKLSFFVLLISILYCCIFNPPKEPITCSPRNTNYTITNTYGAFPDRSICRASEVAYPTIENEVVYMVREAAKARRKMKVATRFSQSIPKWVCLGEEGHIIISTKLLNNVVNVDSGVMTMIVESGVTLKQLIEGAAKAGLALPYAPYWWGMTVGGLLGTGAHGSSLWDKGGCVHEYVIEMRIVTPSGPENNYSEIKILDTNHPDLNAAKVSLGLLGIITQMVFAFTSKLIWSYDVENSKDLAKDVLNLDRGLLAFPIDVPGTNYHSSLKSREKLFKIIRQIVKEKIQSPESRRGDFVDQLVDYMKEESCITQNSITNIVIGLLYASVDTISTTITMIVKFMTENPQVVKELKKENKEVFSNRSLDEAAGWTWDQYRSLTYTTQVINETLRLSSIGPGLLRRAIADIRHADGYVIPKGWIVIVPPSGLHLNQDIYDDCLVFKPSRWQDGNASFIGKQFIPFGVGGRPCIGAQYSKALLACFLHAMIKNYRWTKLKGGEVIRNPLLKLESDFYVKFSKRDPYLE